MHERNIFFADAAPPSPRKAIDAPLYAHDGTPLLVPGGSPSPLGGPQPDESLAREAQFCSDFLCCGQRLADLHALLQHYEAVHVRVEGDHAPFEMPPEQPSAVPSDSSSRPETLPSLAAHLAQAGVPFPPADERLSAFDTTVLRPRSAPPPARIADDAWPGGAALYAAGAGTTSAPAPSPLVRSTDGRASDAQAQVQSIASDPAALHALWRMLPDVCAAPDASPAMLATALQTALSSTVTGGAFTASPAAAAPGAGKAAAQQRAPRPPKDALLDERPYKCTVPGCLKTYKNPNGLKYHALHGHVENRPAKPRALSPYIAAGALAAVCAGPSAAIASAPLGEDAPAGPPTEDELRPYRCAHPGCPKRYKNANGLKYHAQHGHRVRTPPPAAAPSPYILQPLVNPYTGAVRVVPLAAGVPVVPYAAPPVYAMPMAARPPAMALPMAHPPAAHHAASPASPAPAAGPSVADLALIEMALRRERALREARQAQPT